MLKTLTSIPRSVQLNARFVSFPQSRTVWYKSASYRFSFLFTGKDDDKEKKDRQQNSLYLNCVPLIHTNQSRRFTSSTAVTRGIQQQLSSISTAATRQTIANTDIQSTREAENSQVEQLDHKSDLPLSRRDRFRQQAGDFRDRAHETYTYVREHPKQSASTFGEMVKRYGPVFIGTYLGVYLTTLSGLFVLVESGIMDPAGLLDFFGHAHDESSQESHSTVTLVVDFMRSHTWTASYADFIERNPSVANFAFSWIAVKFTEPIRLPIALTLTPRVARYFGYASLGKEAEIAKEHQEVKQKVKEAKVDAEKTSKFSDFEKNNEFIDGKDSKKEANI